MFQSQEIKMDMNMYGMNMCPPAEYLSFPPVFPYGMPNMPAYSSPVSSYQSFYPDTSLRKSDTDTSPSTSNDIDEAKKKQLSPEDYQKYRLKREKNNEAAKQSRKKRTDREKTLSQQIKVLEDVNHNIKEQFTEQLKEQQLANQALLQQNQAMAEEINRLQMQLQRFQQQQQPSVEILGDKTNSIADSKPYTYPQYQPYL